MQGPEYYDARPKGGDKMRSAINLLSIIELTQIKLPEFPRILDLGCSKGIMANIMANMMECRVIAVDWSEARLALAKKGKVLFIRSEIHKYVAATSLFFDLITIFDTLEHLDYPGQLIASCKEILKPGGVVLTKTPANHVDAAHVNVYTKESFDAELQPDESWSRHGGIVATWRRNDVDND